MEAEKAVPILIVSIVAIVVLGIFSISFVQAGERGVTTHWGAVDPNEIPREQGIQFRTPFQDNIVIYDVQTRKYPSASSSFFDSETREAQGIKIASTSRDIQDVFTEVVVIYHLNGDNITNLHSEIGTNYESKVIEPMLKQVAKNTMAQFSAEELITQRDTLKEKILMALDTELANLKQCTNCIVVEDIALTDISFTQQFSDSIESKVRATQKALEAQNDLKRIEFEADQAREKARGLADAEVIKAQGEAQAIELITNAIKENPEYLKWMQLSRWDGAVPKVIGENTPLVQIPMGN